MVPNRSKKKKKRARQKTCAAFRYQSANINNATKSKKCTANHGAAEKIPPTEKKTHWYWCVLVLAATMEGDSGVFSFSILAAGH